MSSRELADEINRRGLYQRPSDGEPLNATQVAARVRRRTYRDRYEIDAQHRVSLASQSSGDPRGLGEGGVAPRVVRGPHGWINWYAERVGNPRRETAHPGTSVINPIWEEFVLYTDAPVDGPWLELGPYELLTLAPAGDIRIGLARRALLLRAWDHLSDALSPATTVRTDVEDYFGGDLGDEFAALLGLALDRRVRSGGCVRKGLPGRHAGLGLASEREHHVPPLESPRGKPMIPWLVEPVSLADAKTLLSTYPELEVADAVAVVRAARQYVDGLWLADLEPRLAWIKLISALEVGANRFDSSRDDSALAQLKRHRSRIYKALQKAPAEVADAIAQETAHLFNVERKLHSFTKRFDPGPPSVRPSEGPARFDWQTLDSALTTIYEHRSRDMHNGVAFPWVLCEPPDEYSGVIPSERFGFSGVSGMGGQWEASDLPMYLHVFAYFTGAVLRNWWASLGEVVS
jgi:hypothetical protein